MEQDGKRILEGLAWTAAERDGLAHDVAAAPEVPPPTALRSRDELIREDRPRYAFWDNLEQRPTEWDPSYPPRPSQQPRHLAWYRFRPRAVFDDPFVNAARALLLVDTMIWPAVWRYHVSEDIVAPSLDAVAWFHRPCDDEWLLCDALSPIGHQGLLGGHARIWSRDGSLVASGGSQLACMSTTARG